MNRNIYSATSQLAQKRDVRVDRELQIVYVLRHDATDKHGQPLRVNDLGNGSWANIDYLTKHAGFTLQWCWEFPKANAFKLAA